MWLLCSLHHEVGHNLDQDFKLSRELKQHLDKTLEAQGIPLDRRTIWTSWTSEILADALGMLLGGAGFGHALTSLLFLLASLTPALDTTGAHPDNYIRIYLIAALLRQTGVDALKHTADEIMKLWDALEKPAGIEPYREESISVAGVFLTQPLNALGNRPLRELVPDLAGDAKQAARLANFFRTGSGFDEPVTPVPSRLVPVAAELALMEMDQLDAPALKQLQERSFKYLKGLKRPAFLGAADRGDFMRQLVEEIDFTEVSL